jgi:tetratricopeptide (TPR) repeat protein
VIICCIRQGLRRPCGDSRPRLSSRAKLGSAISCSLLCWLVILTSTLLVHADSREALQKAADLVQQGRLEEADQQAHLALSDPQTHAVACSVLGTIRFQQKRLPESASFLQEAIRLEPRLLGARLTLAEVYTIQGKTEPALAMYRRILQLDSSNATARLALASSEAEKGNYQKSLTIVGPSLPALKKSPDGLLLLATDYLKTGDRTSAAALAKDWEQLPDASPEWSIKFALLLAKEGVVPEAIEILEGAKQAGTPSYELAFNLAGAYLLKNDNSHALENYDLALNRNPQSVPALLQAAAVAEKSGELERSLSYWIRAKKIEPENPQILLGFGRVCLKMDLLEDAEPALAKAASLRPDEPGYQYTLASAKVGKKQFQAADEILEKLAAKQPQDSQLQYALGSVLYLEGHLADAASHLTDSTRLQPNQLASYYYLALVERDQGHDAEAIQRLEKLLQQYPDHAPSCEALGGLLMNARRYDEAEANLKKAVRLNPKSVKANYQLGLLLARMGKKADADKQLELAKSLRTEDESNSRLQLRLLDPDQ